MDLLRTIKRPLGRLLRSYREARRLRLIHADRIYQLFEQNTLTKLFSLLDVDCVFDIGANAGQYATMLRKQVGYKGLIVSCEPVPYLAELLKRLAAGDDRWHIEDVAISSTDGTAVFNIMKQDQFSSLGTPLHPETFGLEGSNSVVEKITVRTETLCSLYARLQKRFGFGNPFLKLDTQGLDVAIVTAAGDCIHSFVGLQSELAIKRLYSESTDFRDAIQLYLSQGFELTSLVPNNEGHFPRLLEVDCIMTRRDLWTNGGLLSK